MYQIQILKGNKYNFDMGHGFIVLLLELDEKSQWVNASRVLERHLTNNGAKLAAEKFAKKYDADKIIYSNGKAKDLK